MFHLITGGSGSGKSAFAETSICRQYKELIQLGVDVKLYYIATMIPYGEETEKKIQRHREMRSEKGFTTIECYTDLMLVPQEENFKGQENCVLLECMSNLIANEIYGASRDGEDDGKNVVCRILEGIRNLRTFCHHLVVVTNEVCSDSSVDSMEMRKYKQMLGEINCRMAAEADRVTEVVYGNPVSIKGEKSMCKEDKRTVNGGLKMVIGGTSQGKQAFAERKYGEMQWTDGETCSMEALYTCQGILHFEAYIRRMMEEKQDVSRLAATVVQKNPEIIIVSREVGYGLVPIHAFEREYREQTGRICTELAEHAVEVNRVVCGIGVSLKGE